MLIGIPGVMPALRLGMPPTRTCLPATPSRESMPPLFFNTLNTYSGGLGKHATRPETIALPSRRSRAWSPAKQRWRGTFCATHPTLLPAVRR